MQLQLNQQLQQQQQQQQEQKEQIADAEFISYKKASPRTPRAGRQNEGLLQSGSIGAMNQQQQQQQQQQQNTHVSPSLSSLLLGVSDISHASPSPMRSSQPRRGRGGKGARVSHKSP